MCNTDGTLGSIDTDGMFKVKFASKKTAIVEGAPVAVPKIITLVGGWNYLPCPYQSPVELSIAMPKMTYAEDDMVKSQITFSTFCTRAAALEPSNHCHSVSMP